MSPAKGADQTNPFVDMLVDSLSSRGLIVDRFTWPKALFGKYDILQVHWPEALVRSPGQLNRAIKFGLLLVLLGMRRILKRHHVSTVHNMRPHESGSRAERVLIRLWLASCEAKVYLTPSGLTLSADPKGVVIPHGDYSPIVNQFPTETGDRAVPGRLLLFGQLRQYKGIEGLVRSFAAIDDSQLSLRIVGKAISEEYGFELNEMASGVPRLDMATDLALSDRELIAEIARSEIVLLPYQRIYNSGAAFMALSVGRPLIVTRSDSMIALQEEVGAEWVQLLDGDLTEATLSKSVAVLRGLRRGKRPMMPTRAWPVVAQQYEELYHAVAG